MAQVAVQEEVASRPRSDPMGVAITFARIGYGASLAAGAIGVALGPNYGALPLLPVAVFAYVSLHRLHVALGEASQHRYPIGPWAATLKGLIPLYNWYWNAHWPNQVATYAMELDPAMNIGTRRWGWLYLACVVLSNVAIDHPIIPCLGLLGAFAVIERLAGAVRDALSANTVPEEPELLEEPA
jgi:hypothetical protein